MIWLLGLLLMPAGAIIAGSVLWVTSRGEEVDDSKLLRNFLIFLVVAVGLFWQIGRTPAVRMHLDPQFRIQTLLDAEPLYTTIMELAPDQGRQLRAALDARLSQGAKVAEAMQQVRPLLYQMTTERLGFADQKTHIVWARNVTDTLIELQGRSGDLCARMLTNQPFTDSELARTFSPANAEAFRQAVIQVYESANRGMQREWRTDEERLNVSEVQREYATIREELILKFGQEIEGQVTKGEFVVTPATPGDRLCAARIFQLEAMLERRQALASRMIDSALR